MYREKWLNYYFPQKPIQLDDKWSRTRKIAKTLVSTQAQLRLEWIIFYYTVAKSNAKATANHFGVSRKTLHKWLSRFDERNLKSLEEVSRRPARTRGLIVTKIEEERIVSLRKKNMEYGKAKLKVIYQREYHQTISTWKIERVVRKHNLFPDQVKHKFQIEKRAKSKPKIRIHQVKDAIANIGKFGFLWHIDAIIIWWYGQRRVILTAIEELTKIAFARVYTTNSSVNAKDFLTRLMYLTQGEVSIMHQDNGSEFEGAFKKACKTLGILQIYSRPHTPEDNPALERLNNTIQEEWLAFSEVGLDDVEEANKDLTQWLIKYFSYRPHQALDYKTPLEYTQANFPGVLPMSPASTEA